MVVPEICMSLAGAAIVSNQTERREYTSELDSP